jgi:hypothetical protein
MAGTGTGTKVPEITNEWVEQFRENFPEFSHSSPEIFEDSLIEFWETIGQALVNNTGRFLNDKIRNLALQLFVAHNVLVSYNNEQSIYGGDMSGQGTRPITSNSVGDVSVSYDLSKYLEEGAGEYNATVYGRRLFNLINIFCAGGAVVI